MQHILSAIFSLQAQERPLIIAISGFGGSGKSTLAAKLKEQLGDTEVIAADDFIVGRASERSADWNCYDRLRLQRQVLEPALQNKSMSYQVYDWKNDKLSQWRMVPNSKFLIIEGLSMLHPDLRGFYDLKIWVDCPLKIATKRGMARDTSVANDHDALWLNIWVPNERDFFAKYQPKKAADLLYKSY